MATADSAQAVLGGNATEAAQVDQRLKEAQVVHQTYAELQDIVADNHLDLDVDFIQVTIAMANSADDEEWRSQWDAVQNLRILNKFYYSAFERVIDQFSGFIKGQIENLRSNNCRNALCLFNDIFSQNSDRCPDGRRDNDTWSVFLDVNFAAVFAKVNADKKFLQNEAQRGILACVVSSPIPQTISILVKNSSSKVMVQSEFACRALEVLVKAAPPALFHELQHQEQCMQIVHCLCEMLEQRQMKKTKYAKPAMQHVQTMFGGADGLKQVALRAYNSIQAQQKAAASTEEVKEPSAEDQSKLESKIDKIVSSLSVTKKAPAKGGFRSFMQTAKTELKEMQITGLDAASSAAGSGFAMTVGLPQGQPLIDLNATTTTSGEPASAAQPDQTTTSTEHASAAGQ